MRTSAPTVFLVMGVSGTGKSTIASALASALAVPFIEGDDYHPAENVTHLAAGHALTDGMRWPWLDALITACNAAIDEGTSVVLSCSALKRAYRDHLRAGLGPIRIIFLDGAYDLLANRMTARANHFMPTSLLDSQLATLEPPSPNENPIHIDVAHSVTAVISQLLEALSS